MSLGQLGTVARRMTGPRLDLGVGSWRGVVVGLVLAGNDEIVLYWCILLILVGVYYSLSRLIELFLVVKLLVCLILFSFACPSVESEI